MGMAYQYQYGIYNAGQYPADTQKAWDALVADGWQVNTALPAYTEICILWQRELPAADTPDRRAPQQYRENPEQVSGGLRDHEGQDAR